MEWNEAVVKTDEAGLGLQAQTGFGATLPDLQPQAEGKRPVKALLLG